MNLRVTLICLLAIAGAGGLAVGACSDNNTDACPNTLTAGASCDSPDLQCAVDVPITACDGTQSTVTSSCTCQVTSTSNAWVCVDPGNQCPDAESTDDGSTDDGSTDDGSTDDGSTADSPSSDAPDDSANTDAGLDASSDAKKD
jgi:hypothetical protein